MIEEETTPIIYLFHTSVSSNRLSEALDAALSILPPTESETETEDALLEEDRIVVV